MSRLLIKKHNAEDPNDRRYYWWRMLTKQRLYKRHRDLLIQLDSSERVEKLEETVTNVEEGYDALLKAFNAREEALKAKEEESGVLATPESTAVLGEASSRDQRVKRKLTVEDEEDEAENEEAAKRTKV